MGAGFGRFGSFRIRQTCGARPQAAGRASVGRVSYRAQKLAQASAFKKESRVERRSGEGKPPADVDRGHWDQQHVQRGVTQPMNRSGPFLSLCGLPKCCCVGSPLISEPSCAKSDLPQA